MPNRVNPPKTLRLPPTVSKNSELKKSFDDRDYILFQLWKRSGAGDDYVDSNQTNSQRVNGSLLFDIRQQIGSGMPVTIDTTGFTIDTTEQTTDKTEV